MYQTMNLSHVEAQEMIAAVQKQLEADKQTAAVAVADSHGELIAFLRTDGCRLPPVSIAINKAFTAARERKESGAVGQSTRSSSHPMSNFGDIRYTGWAGGFPVLFEGKVIGAIGVSGLTEEEDARLARMAVELVTRKLSR